MSLLWITVAAGITTETSHAGHAMHPALRAAGFGDSPCGWAGCPDFDEDHYDAMDEAYFRKGQIERHDPGTVHLHGMETTINPGAVARYRDHPPHKKAPPKVFTRNGDMHVLDGHHRLLADTLEGRPLVFEHVDLDKDS